VVFTSAARTPRPSTCCATWPVGSMKLNTVASFRVWKAEHEI
jgi:hypothetical protein